MRDTILVVDDMEINRIILREILNQDYDILEAENGLQAIKILFESHNTPQAVLLDIMMPEMDGFEVLHVIKSNPMTEKIPVLFITAADAETNESKVLEEGARDYISKPFNPDVVKARVKIHIQLLHYQTNLEAMVEAKTAALRHVHESMMESLASIIEYRSLESGTHIRRTRELSKVLVEQLLKHPDFQKELLDNGYNELIKAVALHDVGKIGIPDSILLKPDRLTPEEFEVIKTHTIIGANIVDSIYTTSDDQITYLTHCKDICRSHHERWDGSGYPDGLSGEDIPLSARMVSLVDVYDALVNKRCYKGSYSHQKAIELIVEGSGEQFDPRIVDAMLEVENEFQQIEMRLLEYQY